MDKTNCEEECPPKMEPRIAYDKINNNAVVCELNKEKESSQAAKGEASSSLTANGDAGSSMTVIAQIGCSVNALGEPGTLEITIGQAGSSQSVLSQDASSQTGLIVQATEQSSSASDDSFISQSEMGFNFSDRTHSFIASSPAADQEEATRMFGEPGAFEQAGSSQSVLSQDASSQTGLIEQASEQNSSASDDSFICQSEMGLNLIDRIHSLMASCPAADQEEATRMFNYIAADIRARVAIEMRQKEPTSEDDEQ